MKALLVGCGSSWGASFCTHLVKNNYEVDLITSNKAFEYPNVNVKHVDWQSVSEEVIRSVFQNNQPGVYNLIFFNQNSGGFPSYAFKPEHFLGTTAWYKSFFQNCAINYYILKAVKDQIGEHTKIGAMVNGQVVSNDPDMWDHNGYSMMKVANLHMLRAFAFHNLGIYFGLDCKNLYPDFIKKSEVAKDIFEVIDSITANDNGRVIDRFGIRYDF